MNFNFGEVLTRAWKIIWKHKVLWIFGILASCGRGSGGGNSGGGNSGGVNNGFNPHMPPQVLQLTQWIENHLTQFIVILVAVFCVIWIVVAFLSTIGKIGLIRGTSQADGGAESLIFGQLFSESMPYFWRMFGLSLILAIPIVIVVGGLIAGLIVFAISASGGSAASGLSMLAIIPVFIGCLCLFIPITLVVGMIFSQAERAIVLEELGVMPAISRGWEVFRNNLGPIILMAIILGVIGLVVGLVVAIPILIIVFPTMLAYVAGGAQSGAPLIFMGICFCLYLPVLLLLNGVLTAYTESAWTLTYMRLTHKLDSSNISAPIDVDPVQPEDNDKTIIDSRPNA